MPQYKKLFEIFAGITTTRDMDRLLHELLTPKELDDIWRRWQIMEDLCHGVPQRDIADKHSMSLCKVTRGSKVIQDKHSLCRKIIADLSKSKSS